MVTPLAARHGICNCQYKVIYRYSESFDVEDARSADADEKEWELFNGVEDPFELFNIDHDPKYTSIVKEMIDLLWKMR